MCELWMVGIEKVKKKYYQGENNMKREKLSEIEKSHEKAFKRLIKHSKDGDFPKHTELTERCRIWTGYQFGGYGRFKYCGKQTSCHRVSLLIKMGLESLPKQNENGDILETRHLCHEKLCIEPTHLVLGTKIENGEDQRKNGAQRGENHHNATITEDIAVKIKLSKRIKGDPNYKTQSERAIEFGVLKNIVRNIDDGNAWTHLSSINNDDKAKDNGQKRRKRKKELKEVPWTNEQYEEARKKLVDSNYVKECFTRLYNGITCKEWIKGNIAGYGLLNIHGVSVRAHIIACAITNNNIIPDGFEAAHLCGFSLCVEPKHLKFKTPKDNAKDKIEHGTNATIPFDDVLEIRKLYAKGDVTQTYLAKRFNICQSTVSLIIREEIRLNG